MRKKFFGISIILLMLTLIAAQCGAAQPEESGAPAQEAEVAEAVSDSADAASAEDAAATEAETETAVEETAASEDPAALEDAETSEDPAAFTDAAASTDAGAASSDHSAAECEDPFAGAEDIRFSPDVWTAERLARFVGEDIVDPDSGLETNFCIHSIDYGEILSGGPPPDGIPPIDDPTFETIAEADEWLDDVSPVIALTVGDEAKAYPLGILTRHEIANDEIAGVPVAVTFCPLCNASIVFNREVDGEVLRFGVSGNLRNSDLVMWDNKTLSWWQQFTGQAIVGELTGTQLEIIPAQMVAWQDFKAAFPEGVVLSSDGRNYDVNPYAGYDSTTQPFLFRDASGQPATPDPRLPALSRVLGYAEGDTAVAYPLETIAEEKVIQDTIDGQEVVIFFEPGQVSALDEGVISDSKEVGSAGMFIPEVDGLSLTFSYDDGVITDNETGSEWNIFGQAVSGELEGAELEPVLSHVHFWFAWAAFQPETNVYES